MRDKPTARWARWLLPALAGGLVLELMLLGFLFSFSAGYALPVDGAALALVGAALGLVLLLAYSLPRLRWAAFGALALVWAALLWTGRETLLPALRTLLEALGAQLSLSFDLSLLPTGAADGTAVAAVLGLLAFPWAALLGWCVLRGRSPVLALLLTWPLLFPAFVLNAPLNWAALIALLTAHLAFLCASRPGRADVVGGAKLTLLLLPLVALVLAGLTALSPEGSYQFPDWAAAAQVRLLDWAASLPNPFAEGDGVGTARPAQLSETVDLTQAGSPVYSGAAVLELDSERTGLVYLRGYSMAVYTGQGWTALAEDAYAETLPWAGPGELGEGASWLDLLAAYPPALYPAAARPEGETEALTVRDLASPTQWVYTPYQLTETSAALARADTHLARDGSQWQHRFLCQTPGLDGLAALSGEIAQAEQLYQVFVNEHYLSLPDGLADALAPWVDAVEAVYLAEGEEAAAGLPRRYQDSISAALAVARLLEESAVYDLDAPALPEGEDAAVWFLQESGRGYCMHFATTGAVLLRAMGIPARYVAGYAVPVTAAGTTQVPDSAAHAWVEIYLEGYGWYPVEMTPSQGLPVLSANGETEDPQETQPEQEAEPEPETPTPEAPETPEETVEESSSAGTEDSGSASGTGEGLANLLPLLGTLGRVAAGLAAAATVLAGGRWLRRTLLRRRFAPLHQGNTNACVLDLYGLLEDLARWGGQMPEDARALAQKARFSQHRITEEEIAEMRRLFREERHRTEHALPGWKRPLFRLFWHET